MYAQMLYIHLKLAYQMYYTIYYTYNLFTPELFIFQCKTIRQSKIIIVDFCALLEIYLVFVHSLHACCSRYVFHCKIAYTNASHLVRRIWIIVVYENEEKHVWMVLTKCNKERGGPNKCSQFCSHHNKNKPLNKQYGVPWILWKAYKLKQNVLKIKWNIFVKQLPNTRKIQHHVIRTFSGWKLQFG